jgi:hypothetical protein
MNFIVLPGPCIPQPNEAMTILLDGAFCPSTDAGMMEGNPKAAAAPVDFLRKERRVFMDEIGLEGRGSSENAASRRALVWCGLTFDNTAKIASFGMRTRKSRLEPRKFLRLKSE